MKTIKLQGLHMPAKLHTAPFWAFVLFVLLPGFSYAQFFVPAAGTEYTFPVAPGPVNVTTHSFTYTMSHVAYMTNIPGLPLKPVFPPSMPAMPPGCGPLTDLTVHSWDDPGSTAGFSYISTATGSGTPGTVYDQGTVVYPAGVQDIELSLMQDEMGYNMFINGSNAPWYIIVSYYNPGAAGGAGHFFDVYQWNQPPPYGIGGVTWISTTRLSAIGGFTRISQDGHNTYGFCITWENPATGIDFIFGYMNPAILGVSISPVYTLAGTFGQTHPDVAFTHSGAGLNLQFIYYKMVGGSPQITESTIPMQLGPGWIVPPAPVNNDVNILPLVYPPGVTPDLKTRLDAPDHGTDNWAYSYILPPPGGGLPNTDIFVRFNNAAVFTTYTLTNGSMGPLPINPFSNDWPVASFDNNTALLNVEWYTQFKPGGFFAPNTGGYVGIKMNQAGAIVSPLDYLQVAIGGPPTFSNTLASPTPTIASSRQNDRTDYQYVVFANSDLMGMGNEMQDKDRVWANATFKGGHNAEPWAGLYNTTATTTVANVENAVIAYPNPFTDKVALDISSGLLDKTLTITVEDISGKMIDKIEGQGTSINASLGTLSPKLVNGIYFLKIQSASGDFNKVLKVQKLTSN